MSLSRQLIIGGGGVTLFAFGLEVLARSRNSQKKPSVAISWLATKFGTGFTALGVQLAKVSSFLTVIKFGELGAAAHDLFMPTLQLVGSPLQAIAGYYQSAKTYNNPVVIGIGSALLAGAVGWGTVVGTRKLGYTIRVPQVSFKNPIMLKATLGLAAVIVAYKLTWGKKQQ